jgi:hypothetical protein
MLAWIWIYEEGHIKVKFDTFYYYIHVSSPYNRSDSVLRCRIIENTCSRRDKNLGQLVETDYRNLDLDEIYRVIFVEAPLSEREVREHEYFSVKQRDLRVSLIRYNYNQFELIIEKWIRVCIWKTLPWRNQHKKKDVVKWIRSAKEIYYQMNKYSCTTYNNILIPFFDLLWYLKEEGQEDKVVDIIDDMLG